MHLGRMFLQSGNMVKAGQYVQAAIDNVIDVDATKLLDAQLLMVDVQKFRQPVEAQRLLNRLTEACTKSPELLLRHLALDAFISFRLNNATAFTDTYNQYTELCREQGDRLPTTYDACIKAMHEAMTGYYTQALQTLAADGQTDPLTLHDLRIIIYEMSGQQQQVISELHRRILTADSLSAALYDANLAEESTTTSMTVAQQKTMQANSRLLKIVIALAAIIIAMLAVWTYLRRHSQRRLQRKNDQLRAALRMAGETDKMKTEFVQRVSHEIRTPLNAITGFNDILNNSDMELGQEERADLMARINENVKAITNIVDELLQMANAESIDDYAKDDEVLCNQFFRNILYSHSDKVNSRITLNYTTGVINRFTIKTNAEIVGKIVEHLIDNAIKFTQHGHITLDCREKRGMLLVTVTDTGRGVPADKQDEIFEQFAKADAFQQGIGLGLTVSKKIAQKLGGDLVLDKNYTTGASFILSLTVK